MIGLLRPGGFAKGEEDDEDDRVMVGPPRSPTDAYFHDDDDGAMVGPPRPLSVAFGSRDLDDDSYDGVEKNSHRIPMTNEIILKGHSKIYDRDGLTLGEFIKGDMYIPDLKNTKGHISGLTAREWNPRDKNTILTSI